MKVLSIPVLLLSFLLIMMQLPSMVAANETPHFLFIGQSNMEGIVENSSGEPRVDTTLNTLLSSASTMMSEDEIFNELVSFFQTFESIPETSLERYEFEARELIRLKREGSIPNNFRDPLPTVECTFYQLDYSVDYRRPFREPDAVAVNAKLSPSANCGVVYGPELVFGHVLHQQWSSELYRIIKFASGGSEIGRHWSSEDGYFWGDLVNVVEGIDTQAGDEWKGIVWFQGENDSHESRTADAYLTQLTTFLQELRQTMYNVDDTVFASPADIPIVIIGLGCWVATDLQPYGGVVMQAQRDFVANDGMAVLVPTDDLSCHFHYDEASQLIIGERVAKALQGMLPSGSAAETPTPAPVVPSSPAPVVVPTRSPTPAPIRAGLVLFQNQPVQDGWTYTEPEWWNTVESQFNNDYAPLRRCKWLQSPPQSFTRCGINDRACYWGIQDCSGSAFPDSRCVCNRGRWSCTNVSCGSL